MCQLCHYRRVQAFKYFIVLCQSFQIVALCSHSLHDFQYVFDHISGDPYIFFTVAMYLPFPAVVTALSVLSVHLVAKEFIFPHVLRSADFRLHSLTSSLKIPVCTSRVIPFDIIIASEIVCPPDLANYLPFSNYFIIWDRGLAGSYGPIILTALSTRSTSLIAP